MRCVVCNNSDIQHKTVDEEIKLKDDIVLFPVEVLVCSNCGERYYDKATIKTLERIKKLLANQNLDIERDIEYVGKIMRIPSISDISDIPK